MEMIMRGYVWCKILCIVSVSAVFKSCNTNVDLVCSSSLQGHLLECGCPTDPAVGVARRARG
jgi:hypothetical protein